MQRRMSISRLGNRKTRVACSCVKIQLLLLLSLSPEGTEHHHHLLTLASAKVSSDLVVTKDLEGASATMVGVLEEAAAEARVEVTTAGAMKATLGSIERRHAAVVTASDIARPPEKSILLCCRTCV